MAKIITLSDNFNDNSLDTSKWTKFEAGSALVFERNARLEIAYPAASTSSTDGDITSNNTYDLTSSNSFVKIIQMPRSATNADAIFRIMLDTSNWFQFIYEAGTLYIQRRIAGSTTTITSFTFSSTEHAWLQIRESNGLIIWETSSSGIAWTQQATYTYGIAITAMKIMVAGTCYQNESSPGFFIVDNVNIAQTSQTIPKTYLYKVSKMGTYLGLLPNVKSQFGYTQNLNTGAAQLSITIGQSPDATHDNQSVIPLIGNTNSMVQNSNTIQVIETSSDYPTGKTVFMGFIDTWTANFGGSDDIQVIALSDGADLDNYLVTTGESVDVSQATQDASYEFGATQGTYRAFVQQFTVSGGVTDISSIDLTIRRVLANAASGTVQVSVHASAADAETNTSPMGSATNSLVQNDVSDTAKVYNFAFAGGIAVSAGSLYIRVSVTAEVASTDEPYQLFYKASTNPLPAGDLYIETHGVATSFNTPSGFGNTSYNTFNDWGSGANAFTSDNIYANMAAANTAIFYEEYYNWGFSVPTGVSVDGVEVAIEGHYTHSGTRTSQIASVELTGFSPYGTLGSAQPLNLTTDTTLTFGGQYILPSGGAPAVSRINDSTNNGINLKIGIQGSAGTSSYTALIDTVSLKFYTSSWSTATGNDIFFRTYYSGGGTVATYTTQDPTAILRDAVDNYVTQGGLINYDSSSTQLTATSVSYTFQLNTTLEAIKQCLDLAPSDWYWYVDPASRILYFKQTLTTATHTFVVGTHIKELNLEATTQNIRNVVYISGGDDGTGDNILVVRTNPTSIAATGRQLLERISDSNIHDTATATTVADNFLDYHDSETYQSPLLIPAGVYDLTRLNPGDTVGFANSYHSFINSLIVQIAAIERNSEYARLTLGRLPDKTSATIEENKRAITKLQTIDNPTSPT